MATLHILASPLRGQVFDIGQRRTVVLGRDSTCDLPLSKRTLSRHHAQIMLASDGYFIEDNESTNGTFVNGKRVHHRTPLSDGDMITLHDFPLLFKAESSSLASDTDHEFGTLSEGDLPHQDDTCQTLNAGETIMPEPSAIGRLDSLIAIAHALGSSLDLEDILPRTLDILFQMFPTAVLGEIHISNDEHQLVPVAMKHGRESDSHDLTLKSSHQHLIYTVYHSSQATLDNQTFQDEYSVLDGGQSSTMCVPILNHRRDSMGVILIRSEDAMIPFGENELDLMSAVGVLAAQSISYSRTHQMAVRLERTERALETARTIQLATLPNHRPEIEGYQFSDYYDPAEKVGGDCYFYEPLEDGRIVFGIADASGKGLSAAMHIMRFVGEVRLSFAVARTFKQALNRINRFTCECREAGFVTSCICVLDPDSHSLSIANAGHIPPILVNTDQQRGKVLELPNGSFPFGITGDNEFHPSHLTFKPHHQFFIMTDGITETIGDNDQLFGLQHTIESLSRDCSDLNQNIDHLVESADQFRANPLHCDDICIVGLSRN